MGGFYLNDMVSMGLRFLRSTVAVDVYFYGCSSAVKEGYWGD